VQLGIQSPSVCEEFVHSVRASLSASPDTALLRLDLHNAFNCVDCEALAQKVAPYFPELLPYHGMIYRLFGPSQPFVTG